MKGLSLALLFQALSSWKEYDGPCLKALHVFWWSEHRHVLLLLFGALPSMCRSLALLIPCQSVGLCRFLMIGYGRNVIMVEIHARSVQSVSQVSIARRHVLWYHTVRNLEFFDRAETTKLMILTTTACYGVKMRKTMATCPTGTLQRISFHLFPSFL